ncbi:hypothetical protein EI982_12145 [Haloplanus rallus]|jgi:hypothetical protein|uniref:DUF7967 domain-containing protein n=1 Tax=Haloplanus rallus TaxID=1816183 RepID=A0A6B9FAC9_9EURY|nr:MULTISPECIES: hypothetical protein [Haloplanus]QGX95484.1 hypothetical protein EI982_12145 [Haloplanus rallus]
MSDGSTRLWLVERTYDDKGLISLVYATTDGEAVRRIERAPIAVERSGGVTAAVEAERDALAPVEEASLRERYAAEAERMAENHDPEETV